MLTKAGTDGILWYEPGDPTFSDVAASPHEIVQQKMDCFDMTALPTKTIDRRLLPEYGGNI